MPLLFPLPAKGRDKGTFARPTRRRETSYAGGSFLPKKKVGERGRALVLDSRRRFGERAVTERAGSIVNKSREVYVGGGKKLRNV